MNIKLAMGSALLGAILLTAPAQATVFNISDVDVSARDVDPGLVIEITNILPTPYATPDLGVGDMHYISQLFTIGTDESAINNDDTVAYPISVTFTFSSPAFGGTVNGDTFGSSIFFGIIQGASVVWDGPVDLAFGTGGILRIELDDVIFAGGIGGLNIFSHKDVGAKLTLIADSVPEPGTLMLLGMGLAGLGLAGRRRKAA